MRTTALALSFIALVPGVALACPVCGLAGTQDNWQAYLSMSAMLSLLPLGMIGGIAFLVYRRVSAHDRVAESPEPAARSARL